MRQLGQAQAVLRDSFSPIVTVAVPEGLKQQSLLQEVQFVAGIRLLLHSCQQASIKVRMHPLDLAGQLAPLREAALQKQAKRHKGKTYQREYNDQQERPLEMGLALLLEDNQSQAQEACSGPTRRQTTPQTKAPLALREYPDPFM